MVQFTVALAATILAGSVVAHPGHDVRQEALERRKFIESKPRDVASCAAKLKARGHTDRAIERRVALAKNMMKKRSFEEVLAKNHKSNLTGITPETDPEILFADNTNCVLQPETTEGPYYVSGELIRKDLREGQAGVDAYVYIQAVDTSNCEPLDNIYIDFWHCNSTGVYGGVAANGNGNSADASIINATFARGLQATDEDGVAEFLTIIPGHYTGRTHHIHILTHDPSDSTLYPNGTLGTNALLATHVGQIFFDQDLVNEVETLSPYSTNTQPLTTNADDSIMASESETSDPVLEYVLLGDTLSDGILGWITIGIDTTNSIDVVNAAYVDATGGHATGRSGGGGFPPGNGSFTGNGSLSGAPPA